MDFKEPIIISRPAFKIAGKLYRGDNANQEIPQLWREYGPLMNRIEHVVDRHVSYGVMDNFDEQTKEFDYVAAQEVSELGELPEGLVVWEVPSQTYAVVTCTLPALMEAYDYVYKQWLPGSDYVRAPGLEFELYDERFHPEQPHSEMDLYIPIIEK